MFSPSFWKCHNLLLLAHHEPFSSGTCSFLEVKTGHAFPSKDMAIKAPIIQQIRVVALEQLQSVTVIIHWWRSPAPWLVPRSVSLSTPLAVREPDFQSLAVHLIAIINYTLRNSLCMPLLWMFRLNSSNTFFCWYLTIKNSLSEINSTRFFNFSLKVILTNYITKGMKKEWGNTYCKS